MRSIFLSALCIGLFATTALAQNPRSTQNLDGSGSFIFDPAIGSGGDITVAGWSEDNSVIVRVSDGQGITWSAEATLDTLPLVRNDLQAGNIQVLGSNVYVFWEDFRFDNASGTQERELFYAKSTDGGVTWGAETQIDNGAADGVGRQDSYRITAANVGGMDHIHVAMSTDPDNASSESILVNSTSDGGATWTGAIAISSNGAGVADVDFNPSICVDGSTVHVIWADDRNAASQNDTFYQKSTDAGVTWLVADIQIDGANAAGDTQSSTSLACSGSTVLAGWIEEPTGSGDEEARVAVSADGGATWGADVLVGPTAVANDSDGNEVAIVGSNLISLTRDNRSGSDQVQVDVSTDGFATSTTTALTANGGGFARFCQTNDGFGDTVGVVFGQGAGSPENAGCAWSRDGGTTWHTEIVVEQNIGDVDFTEGAYNALYNNILVFWMDDTQGFNNSYVGGLRPQTVDMVGVLSAGNVVSFDASEFNAGEEGDVFVVLASGTAGSLSLPGDVRSTGLAVDVFLNQSKNKASLKGVIGAGGAGSTPGSIVPGPSKLPVGTTLLLIAFTKDVGTFGSITDIVSETVL